MVAFENKGAMAATVVVAASDSLNKAAANYVCDGVNDDVEINAAIDALPAGGGKVVLLDGTYNITLAQISISKDNVKLEGFGKNTVLNKARNGNILGIDHDNIVISDIFFEGNKATRDGDCISIIGGTNVKLVRLIIKDPASDSIVINNAERVYVLQCYVTGAGDDNIVIENDSHYVYIIENYILDSVEDLVIIRLNALPCSMIVVASNIMHGGRYGVITDGSTSVVIANNLMEDTGSAGVAFRSVRNAIVGNIIYNALTGIENISATADTIIIGNVIDTPRESGMDIHGTNLIIIGNTCKNAGVGYVGIWLDGATYCTVSGNRCYDDRGVKLQVYGIYESGLANYNFIDGNYVVGNLTGGAVKVGANTILRNNVGHTTENSGTATVLNTTTSIVVNHGLATTPTRVIVTPRENPTNAVSFWWVDTLTATQFTIHVNADPGASNLDFDWHAQVGEG